MEQYPEIRYRSSSIKQQRSHESRDLGELTVRDVTYRGSLEARYLDRSTTPYWDDGEDKAPVERIGSRTLIRINRHDFNVNWLSEFPDGDSLVGDTVWIIPDIEALPPGCFYEFIGPDP